MKEKRIRRAARPASRSAKRPRATRKSFASSPPAPSEVHFSQEIPLLTDLPFSYGETKLVLLVRDPYWAYSYWDFSWETWNWIQRKLALDRSLKTILRVHDLDAKHFFDLLISLEAKNWYLHLGTPDHRYVAELGLSNGNARFYLIARSHEVRTPRDLPSGLVDPEWSDFDFDEIYRLSGGGKPGLSSPGSLVISRQV